MGIFNNHINVFGSHYAPILIMSITKVNANLGLEWINKSTLSDKKKPVGT